MIDFWYLRWLSHVVVHPCLQGLVYVSLVGVGTQTANVGALVEIEVVQSALLHTLEYAVSRLYSIYEGHAVVHEYQPIGCLLSTLIYLQVALLDHIDSLPAPDSYIWTNSLIFKYHLKGLSEEHLIVNDQDLWSFQSLFYLIFF